MDTINDPAYQADLDLENDTITVREIPAMQNALAQPQPAGINDQYGLKGEVLFTLRDSRTGEIKQQQHIKNLVVATGKNYMAKKLNAESVNEMTHVGIGTSNQAAASGDTGLVGTQIVRVSATKARTTNAVKFTATYPAGTGTSSTINEAGIFDGAAGTEMLARVVTASTINKGASDELTIEWTITAA